MVSPQPWGLTKRQQQVLDVMVECGGCLKSTAKRLSRSIQTIASHSKAARQTMREATDTEMFGVSAPLLLWQAYRLGAIEAPMIEQRDTRFTETIPSVRMVTLTDGRTMTVSQASAAVGLSKKTIYDYAKMGRQVPVKEP